MAGKPVEPGAYNRRLTIERQAPTTTASGGVKPNWATVATVFASLATKGYAEYHLGERVRERNTVTYKTRRPPTTPVYAVGDRITDAASGTQYTILSIDDTGGAMRELLITAQDIKPATA
jgi:hypothetical protein